MSKVKLSAIDKFALSISPQWGMKRLAARVAVGKMEAAGYVVPGSRRKSMKGVTARANSPDRDIIGKLEGTRALSRDMAMNSPLAISILRRHKINIINAGLQYQARVDREYLGLAHKEADALENTLEREFDLWAGNPSCDFEGRLCYGEMQALAFYNMLLSGDVFFMLPWQDSPSSPYELCVKLIDGDLIRDPENKDGRDIEGGVEKDAAGRVVAYHVWNTYNSEYTWTKVGKSTRVPVFDKNGRRQIFQLMDPERIGQRRGVPLLAPVADALKQLTRLSEAELMSALISSYFTVFVKDMSGLDSLLQEGLPEHDTEYGGGGAGPEAEQADKTDGDEFDLEMGVGNIVYTGPDKEIQIADPKKSDEGFEPFWNALAMQVCAGGNMSIEQAMMKYTTSYTAAKAAANDAYKFTKFSRTLINRGMNRPVLEEQQTEAILKGRINAPGYFDDLAIKKAYSRGIWNGVTQGELNPLQETKASVLKVVNKLSTRADQFVSDNDSRWDAAMYRYSREDDLLEELGIVDKQAEDEMTGPDGQENDEEGND